MTKLTLDKAGRLALRKKPRQELHLRAGDKIQLESEGEQITLNPVRPLAGLKKKPDKKRRALAHCAPFRLGWFRDGRLRRDELRTIVFDRKTRTQMNRRGVYTESRTLPPTTV